MYEDKDYSLTKVNILGSQSIHCGFHLFPYISNTIIRNLKSSAYVFITDSTIANLHLNRLQNEFNHTLNELNSSAKVLSYVVPPGEGSKSRAVKEEIEDWMFSNRLTRDTVVIALGGGVIGKFHYNCYLFT